MSGGKKMAAGPNDPSPNNPNRPPNPNRPIPIVPHPNRPPWTDEELDAIVERAIQYIEEAKQKWGLRFGLAVGEWLYRELFGMDDAYLRSKDPGKTRSLYDIAKRTGHRPRTLRTWVWAARMKLRLASEGFTSESLMLTDWSALYPLRDRPLAARQVAEWVHNENPTVDEVIEYVRKWKKHKRNPPKPPPRPRPEPRKRRKRPYELRLLRVMGLVHRWLVEVEMSRPLRERLLVQVREIKAMVKSGVRA